MTNSDIQLRDLIDHSLRAFATGRLADRALALFEALGYRSSRRIDLSPNSADNFIDSYGQNYQPDRAKALLDEWRTVDLLLQLSDSEIRQGSQLRMVFDSSARVNDARIESYVFMAIGLRGDSYTRTQLATITREVNRMFPMPVLVLFRHGDTLTLSVIDRRVNRRDEQKDVLKKVTLIKDIRIANVHRAHIDILLDLSFAKLFEQHRFTNFVQLQDAWSKTLDISELNKKFYREIANWYFWAKQNVTFPIGAGADEEQRNATSVIRLLTRLIFVWFLKEKGLVPDALFDERRLKDLLLDIAPNESTYYKAILQNLFFATLNTEMDSASRKRFGEDGKRANDDYMVHNVYRYEEAFKDPQGFLKLCQSVPFLNGGLFECLDRVVDADDLAENPLLKDLVKQEGSRKILRIDGFSRRAENPLAVPNELFFAEKVTVDLNSIFDTKNRDYSARGLIKIFGSYKFTVAENTPIEEEVALDPELLGKVFENLLAAYNPETDITARKQTGSFYTPREIVNYMVDEALLGYFEAKLASVSADGQGDGTLRARLRTLLAYSSDDPKFDTAEKTRLVRAIDTLKILDPACGSGAFPMGILHKLVHVLSRLDDKNRLWKEAQLRRTRSVSDTADRAEEIADIERTFDRSEPDYCRKLFLLENCIHGVDIQPIAVQISKLRSFISLIVDDKPDETQDNRGIIPLPNLETKFIAANSLVGLEQGQQIVMKSPEIEAIEAERAQLRHLKFKPHSFKKKEQYRKSDKELRAQLRKLLRRGDLSDAVSAALAKWDPDDQNATSGVFDPAWMFGIDDGFDVVIGNPPYMRVQGLQKTQPEFVQYYQDHFEAAKGSFDLYAVFIERAYLLLNGSGQLAFIVPHKFFQAAFGEALRRMLTRRRALRQVVRFGSVQVFEEATTYTCLLFLSAKPNDGFDLFEVKSLARGEETLQAVRRREQNADYAYEALPAPTIPERGKQTDWDFSVGEENRVLRRLQQHEKRLEDVTRKIFVGLQTSADKIYVLELLSEDGDVLRCFSKQLDEEVEIERGLVKPFLMGKDVHRYEPVVARNVVIFPYQIVQGKAALMSQSYIRREFPLGWKYLKRNQQDLGEREKGRMHGDDFYAYIYPKNLVEFDTIKIMTPDICNGPEMSIDLSGRYYHTTTVYSFVFKPDVDGDAKFHLGLLNSRVLWYFIAMTGAVLRGGYLRFKTEYLKPFPIAKASTEQQQTIATLVDYLLYVKAMKLSGDSDVVAEQAVMAAFFEQLIDAVVYEMYFPEEFSDKGVRPTTLLLAEQLRPLENIRGNKATALHVHFEKLYDKGHPIRSMLYFLDTIEAVRVIEEKTKSL